MAHKLTVARGAVALDVAWHTANDAVLDKERFCGSALGFRNLTNYGGHTSLKFSASEK